MCSGDVQAGTRFLEPAPPVGKRQRLTAMIPSTGWRRWLRSEIDLSPHGHDVGVTVAKARSFHECVHIVELQFGVTVEVPVQTRCQIVQLTTGDACHRTDKKVS